jgi:hypothetical protein
MFIQTRSSFLFPFHSADEANALKLWQANDEVSLKQLLDFFKRICKETHLAHLVFATSEYFFNTWLQSSRYYSCLQH